MRSFSLMLDILKHINGNVPKHPILPWVILPKAQTWLIGTQNHWNKLYILNQISHSVTPYYQIISKGPQLWGRSKGNESGFELRASRTTCIPVPISTSMAWDKLMNLDILNYQGRRNNTYHAYLKGSFGGSSVLRMSCRVNQMEGGIYFAFCIFKDESNAPFFLCDLLENLFPSKFELFRWHDAWLDIFLNLIWIFSVLFKIYERTSSCLFWKSHSPRK